MRSLAYPTPHAPPSNHAHWLRRSTAVSGGVAGTTVTVRARVAAATNSGSLEELCFHHRPQDPCRNTVTAYLGYASALCNTMAKRKAANAAAQPAGPAYEYCPNHNAGLSCASHKDFCYLCEFSRHDVGDTNYVEELRQLALQLGAEHKELPVVVKAVSRAYDEGAKQFVVWENPDTKEIIEHPEWSRASITRHLLHCVEFGFYDDTITYILQKLIATEQQTVLNPVDNTVIDEQKSRLFNSIKVYGEWLDKKQKRLKTCR